MHFVVSHIFREDNIFADKLANFGLSIIDVLWWDLVPSFIREDFFRNRMGFPNFRFKEK